MKKVIVTLFIFSLLYSISPPVIANEEFGYTVDPRVIINQDGTADFDIQVTGVDVYAGAQFELILSEGVSIESISFDKGTGFSTIAPTYARGSYFFSLIAGTNEYEGDFICTVSILYEGTEPAEITVAEIQTYFIISPGDVETYANDTKTVIEVLPFGYVVIGDTAIPLSWLRKNWIWIVLLIVVAAAIITLFALRRRKRKKAESAAAESQSVGKSGSEQITIDKAEYERLMALKDKTGNDDKRD